MFREVPADRPTAYGILRPIAKLEVVIRLIYHKVLLFCHGHTNSTDKDLRKWNEAKVIARSQLANKRINLSNERASKFNTYPFAIYLSLSAIMFVKKNPANGGETPGVEGLLPIVEDRLQKEVFAKTSGKRFSSYFFARFSASG